MSADEPLYAHLQGDPRKFDVFLVHVTVPPEPKTGYTKHWRIELHHAGKPCFVFQINGKDKTWYNKAQARNEARSRCHTQNWQNNLREVE